MTCWFHSDIDTKMLSFGEVLEECLNSTCLLMMFSTFVQEMLLVDMCLECIQSAETHIAMLALISIDNF